MARGRHYAKLSLSNAARLSFSDLCILLFLFLSLCRLWVCVFLCSHWSLVDVPLIFFCPADHVPDWQPRVLLGMVEARSVNVKKTTTTTVYEKTPNLHQSHICRWGAQPYLVGPLSRLVGKPPHSPWVSTNVLPLPQVGNNTNSAISLTEIFDRVFSDVCNNLGFEVQKQNTVSDCAGSKTTLLPGEDRGMIINETGTAVHRSLKKNEKKKETRN